MLFKIFKTAMCALYEESTFHSMFTDWDFSVFVVGQVLN